MSPQGQMAGGILPMPTAVLQRSNHGGNGAPAKANASRLKLVLRRLAPELTQAEFEAALGDDWKLGGGKMDWVFYKAGKTSRDLSKPSRPSRAYLHLTSQAHLQPLSDHVRATSFQDAKNTYKDACLIGSPSLEFAPYPKVPPSKKRNDQRQGTIDQDADFQAFLQSLTDPITKPAPHESESEALPKEVTTTPLIEAIRERKAAKERAARDKAAKGREAARAGKEEKAVDKAKADKGAKGAKDAGPEKGKKLAKNDKATKETVKVLNTQAAALNAKQKKSEPPDSPATLPTPERKRERGNASIAKQMLARDLGLGPAPGRRGKREPPAGAGGPIKPSEPPTGPKASTPAAATPHTAPAASATPEKSASRRDNRPTRAERRAHKAAQADQPKSQAAPASSSSAPTILKKEPPTGPASHKVATTATDVPLTNPASTRAPPTGPRSPSVPASAPSGPSAPILPLTNRHAFLKHANPSQGITEALLQDALSVHGPIDSVEIDKRKGFAYATFATPEGLRAAMKASPIKVAEGAVVVLEKREGGTGGRGQQGSMRGIGPIPRGGRGGRGGHASRGGRGGGSGAGGSGASSPAMATAQASKIASSAPAQLGAISNP